MSDPIQHILIIDDNSARVRRMRKILEQAFPQSKSWWAKSMLTGHKQIAARMPDVVLVNFHLAERSFEENLAAWTAISSRVPFIAVAEKTTSPQMKTLLDIGALGNIPDDEHMEIVLPHISQCAMSSTLRIQRHREREWILRALFKISNDMILIVDPATGLIRQENKKARDTYGYSSEEFREMHLDDLRVPAEMAPRDTHRTEELIGRASDVGHEAHITRTGRLLYVAIRQTEIQLHDGPNLALVIQDVSHIRDREEEIAFLQNFNSHILNRLPIGITVKMKSGRITYQNAVAKEAFGQLVGHTVKEATEKDPLNQPLVDIEKQLLESDASWPVEAEWRNRQYTFSHLQIEGAHQLQDLTVELAMDVTEQKRIQEDLMNAQRMEAVGNLAGGIAHDFNNLLSGIMGYANLIAAVEEDNEQVIQYADVIEETCSRAADLTQQLLQFSRRKPKLNEPFDISTIARYAGKLLRHSFKKEIQLVQRVSSKKIMVQGDPAQVQQLIVNLGLNANESMTDGQVTLRTDRVVVEEGSDLHVEGLEPGRYAVVFLSDTGRGIDPESLKFLLNPYFSGHHDGEPVDLKLSVVQAIVRTMGGRVLVLSDPEAGSTVAVYLPEKVEKEPEPEGIEEVPGGPVHGTETVLIIDDEEVIRNLMLTSLSRFGYRVLVASGGEEGLKLYTMFQNDINLVMIDYGMPQMDGAKVFQLLKSLNPQVKAILFSGANQRKHMKKLIDEGAISWVAKPISLKSLTRTLREALDGESEPPQKK